MGQHPESTHKTSITLPFQDSSRKNKNSNHCSAENAKFGMDLSFVAARRTRRANAVLFAMVSLTLVVQLPFH